MLKTQIFQIPYSQNNFEVGMVPALEIINFSTLSLVTLSKTNQLGPYLAGLIEGDGSIIVPSKPKSPSGSLMRSPIPLRSSLACFLVASNQSRGGRGVHSP